MSGLWLASIILTITKPKSEVNFLRAKKKKTALNPIKIANGISRKRARSNTSEEAKLYKSKTYSIP